MTAAIKWEEFYADRQNFAHLFRDRRALLDQSNERDLTADERAQLTICNDMIDGKLS